MDIQTFKPHLAKMFGELTNFQFDVSSQLYIPTNPPVNTRANARAPMSLSETDLPTWIIFTGPGTYPVPPDSSYDRLQKETRDFECKLFVEVGQAGIDGEAEAKVEPYLDPARTLIQSHPLLQEDTAPSYMPGIERGYLVKDRGVTTLVYGKGLVSYVGLWFTVRVEAYNEAPNYAQGQ